MKRTDKVEEKDFGVIFDIISRRRARALMSVNVENLLTYWEVGAYLSGKIASDGWGKSTIDRLVVYIKTHDPTAKGYGRSNLYGMVAFYEAFSREDFLSLVEHYHNRLPQLPESVDAGIVQPVAGQLKRGVKAQPLVAQIVQPVAGQSFPKILFLSTFTSLQLILNHCKTAQEWLFYIIYAYRERLTKRELMSVLAHDAYTAVLGSDPKNYSKELKKKYPTVPLLIKDTAFVDYLSLPEKHREKKLSRTMSPVMVAQYKKQLIPKEVLQRTFEEYLALPETIPEADGDKAIGGCLPGKNRVGLKK